MAPDEPGQTDLPAALVTVHISVWCVDAEGNTDGPYTQAFDVPYDEDFAAVESRATEIAQFMCMSGQFGLVPTGAQFAVWEFRPPMYYQYFRGA